MASLTGQVIRRTFAGGRPARGPIPGSVSSQGENPDSLWPQRHEVAAADRDPAVRLCEQRLRVPHHLTRLGIAQIPLIQVPKPYAVEALRVLEQ